MDALLLAIDVVSLHEVQSRRDRSVAGGSSPRRLSGLVRAMLTGIRRHADGRLTLSRLSRELSRQAEYLGWLFLHETGRTFHQRLTTVRLRRAARLIRDGEKIDAVVLLVGYRAKKNFYCQFRRAFGVTPGEYRDRVARGEPRPQPYWGASRASQATGDAAPSQPTP